MASGLSPQLPLVVSEVFGAYNLNTNFEDLARQNLKMLILKSNFLAKISPDISPDIYDNIIGKNNGGGGRRPPPPLFLGRRSRPPIIYCRKYVPIARLATLI